MSGPPVPPNASGILPDSQALADAGGATPIAAITQAPGLINDAPGPMFGDGPPEPTRVYGYVAFVDPGTGSEYIPNGLYGQPTRTDGYPTHISLAFATPAGPQVNLFLGDEYWWREVVRLPDGSLSHRPRNSGGFAWYYDIVLEQDRTAGAPDPFHTEPRDDRLQVVTYNPDYFRFAGVGSTIPYVGEAAPPAVFTRRVAHFPDLPDTL
jgi:hypothetical protein